MTHCSFTLPKIYKGILLIFLLDLINYVKNDEIGEKFTVVEPCWLPSHRWHEPVAHLPIASRLAVGIYAPLGIAFRAKPLSVYQTDERRLDRVTCGYTKLARFRLQKCTPSCPYLACKESLSCWSCASSARMARSPAVCWDNCDLNSASDCLEACRTIKDPMKYT